MSVPPSSRTQARSSRFRLREILWLLSAIVLLILLGMNVAPESWLQRVRVPRTEWSAPRPEKAPSPDSTDFSPEGAAPPVEVPTPVDSQERVSAKPPKPVARGVAQDQLWLPLVAELVPPAAASGLKIDKVEAVVLRSPRFNLIGGGEKPFVPGPWVQIGANLTTAREFRRIAVLYEVEAYGTIYTDGVAHEEVPAGTSLVAVGYIPPSRARELVSGEPLEVLPGVRYRVAVFENGKLLAVAKSNSASRAMNYVAGYIRPRSATPFAPIAWDAFLPDSGLAVRSDFFGTDAKLTKTSPGR